MADHKERRSTASSVLAKCLDMLTGIEEPSEKELEEAKDLGLEFESADDQRERIIRALAAFYNVKLTTASILEDLIEAVRTNKNGLGSDLKDALE